MAANSTTLNENLSKWYIWTGHIFFWSAILACLLLYRERLLSFDTAYYTFHLVTFQDFFIKHDRYISYLTQWIPLLGVDLGWSLANVLRAYSVSFYLLFYGMFLVVVYGLRNPLGGLLLVGALCMGMRYKFYAAISEITFGLVIAAFLLAWLTGRPEKYRLRWMDFGMVIICLFALFGAHIAPLYPILVFLVFERLYDGSWRPVKRWIMPLFIVLVFAGKFFMVQGDDYESDRLANLLDPEAIQALFQNPQEYYVFSAIKDYFTTQYVLPTLAFFMSIGWLIWQRKAAAGLFMLAAFLGWVLINIITYSDLAGPIYIMLDGYLALLGLIWMTPFYFILRDNPRWPFAMAMTVILGVSTWQMISTYSFYRQRLVFIEETLAMHPEPEQKKLIVPWNLFEWNTMWFPYELPHETLMLTALKNPDSCRSIYVLIDAPLDADFLDTDGFIQFQGAHDASTINSSPYFNLPEMPYVEADTTAWK